MDQEYGWKQMGGRLSACRQNRNMTQETLAGRLGVTPQALSKWERGQSFPDVSMLADVACLLGVSTDYLLGVDERNTRAEESGRQQKMQIETGNRLRTSLEPLELTFGRELIDFFADGRIYDEIAELRNKLAGEGILLPVLRIRDDLELEAREFMILAYRNVLYSENMESGDEKMPDYMIRKLGECVRQKYYEILNPDIVKELTDNLRIRFPALIEGIVPDVISYGLLTDVMKKALAGGGRTAYLPKMIEITGSALRENPQASVSALAEQILRETERADSYWNVMAGRK